MKFYEASAKIVLKSKPLVSFIKFSITSHEECQLLLSHHQKHKWQATCISMKFSIINNNASDVPHMCSVPQKTHMRVFHPQKFIESKDFTATLKLLICHQCSPKTPI